MCVGKAIGQGKPRAVNLTVETDAKLINMSSAYGTLVFPLTVVAPPDASDERKAL
jgi:hypothetical protein